MTPQEIAFDAEPTVPTEVEDAALVVDVEGFEGPLDLLLTLARQQKVDLAKISILALADQFLEGIEVVRELRVVLQLRKDDVFRPVFDRHRAPTLSA